jgi:hypothetical protein
MVACGIGVGSDAANEVAAETATFATSRLSSAQERLADAAVFQIIQLDPLNSPLLSHNGKFQPIRLVILTSPLNLFYQSVQTLQTSELGTRDNVSLGSELVR